jgi:hypothetical protein
MFPLPSFLHRIKLTLDETGTLDDSNTVAHLKPVAELFAPSRISWVSEIEGAAQKQAMS